MIKVDTLYSEVAIDGNLQARYMDDYFTMYIARDLNSTNLMVGDWYDMSMMCGEEYSRAYVSFDISLCGLERTECC